MQKIRLKKLNSNIEKAYIFYGEVLLLSQIKHTKEEEV
ncbi:hypothetical protein ADIAL_2156 [Alkalibacterium sp. AK22]|nr:hypothetical protein ADIAL_2156 [Alkalibacterium sp. AK22]